jgi:hypothetical protein
MRPENTAMNATTLTTLKKSAMWQLWSRAYQREIKGGPILINRVSTDPGCQWTAVDRPTRVAVHVAGRRRASIDYSEW